MRSKISNIALAIGALLVAGGFLATAVSAHHSIAANYDLHKTVKFTGTVVKLEFINPHSYLSVDVKSPSGKVQRWGLELAGLGGLKRSGLSRSAGVTPGAQVTFSAYGAKDGSTTGYLRELTIPDGRTLKFGTDAGNDPE